MSSVISQVSQNVQRDSALNRQPGDLVPSVQEQTILANIQELQRQLFEVKAEQEKIEDDNADPLKHIPEEEKMTLIMVSNRLPISVQYDEKELQYNFKVSSGGLITALQGVRDQMNFKW